MMDSDYISSGPANYSVDLTVMLWDDWHLVDDPT